MTLYTADSLVYIHSFQAEGTDAFSQFHLYVCSAFLVKWSDRLKDMDFQVRCLAYRKNNSHALVGDHYVSTVSAHARLAGSRH